MFSPPKISLTVWGIKYICLHLFTVFYLIQPSSKQIICFDFRKQNSVLPIVVYVPCLTWDINLKRNIPMDFSSGIDWQILTFPVNWQIQLVLVIRQLLWGLSYGLLKEPILALLLDFLFAVLIIRDLHIRRMYLSPTTCDNCSPVNGSLRLVTVRILTLNMTGIWAVDINEKIT
jgi:hypothetical protein